MDHIDDITKHCNSCLSRLSAIFDTGSVSLENYKDTVNLLFVSSTHYSSSMDTMDIDALASLSKLRNEIGKVSRVTLNDAYAHLVQLSDAVLTSTLRTLFIVHSVLKKKMQTNCFAKSPTSINRYFSIISKKTTFLAYIWYWKHRCYSPNGGS